MFKGVSAAAFFATVSLLAVPCSAYDVLLRWTVPPQPDIAGYRVYAGSASRQYGPPTDVGLLPGATLDGVVYYLYPNVPLASPTYFAVTAYDAAKIESDYSNERTFALATVAPPTADAGPNQSGLVGDTFTLGAVSLAGVSYFWQQLSGPAALLSGRSSSSVQFTATAAGTYTFALTVRDMTGVAAQSTVAVVVSTAPANPTPMPTPIATLGSTNIGSYAILPGAPDAMMRASVGSSSHVAGGVCAYTLQALSATQIAADAIALKATGWAISLGALAIVGGDIVTAGGNIIEPASAWVGGGQSTDGGAAELGACRAAAARAAAKRAALSSASPQMRLDPIKVVHDTTQYIGPLAPGQIVIVTPEINVGRGASLTIIGSSTTSQVIVWVGGRMRLQRQASITLAGALTADKVLFVVDRAFSTGTNARLMGSVLGADSVQVGQGTSVDGQLLSNRQVQLRRLTTVNLRPFAGW